MIKSDHIKLKESTGASVTTLVDNYVDVLLPNQEHVERPKLMKGDVRRGPLLAEHGLSFMIEVKDDSEEHAIIMDFGISRISMPHNISQLEIHMGKVEAFFITHGHHDHIGAIKEVLGAFDKPVEIIVHPDAFLDSRLHKFADGREVAIPSLKKDRIDLSRFTVVEVSETMLLANGHIGTLTNIPRETDFETGMPTTYYRKNGDLYKDHIKDDQGLVINIRNRGLVVITGCGHSGIINTIRYAQRITGENRIYAVLGGFHLTGTHFEKIIPRTVEEMKKFSPEIIVPCHCTGWNAIEAFKKAFPESFILNSVGTKINLH